jgi:hypothetical protein
MLGVGSQLSVAVAEPVLAGRDDSLQFITTLPGQLITGLAKSVIVITCVKTDATTLLQSSITVQVLV